MTLHITKRLSLAPYTTLKLGGKARYFFESKQADDLPAVLAWAEKRKVPFFILGGGSNLVVSDEGFDGLVISMNHRGLVHHTETVSPHNKGASSHDEKVLITAMAGEPWDEFVKYCVDRNWAGLECLSGIPGKVGATPIQNVGAYGQEVSETIHTVRVLDTRTDRVEHWSPLDCAFGYRTSRFKQYPGRWIVLAVTYALCPNGQPSLGYPELQKNMQALSENPPSLRQVRDAVLALRKKKSMVLDPEDPNATSAGSFFMNPTLTWVQYIDLRHRATQAGLLTEQEEPPNFPMDGRIKVPAAWLIEQSGFQKGTRHGGVGISQHHALALVHFENGTSSELIELAKMIQSKVQEIFGVTLHPEPQWLGFQENPFQ